MKGRLPTATQHDPECAHDHSGPIDAHPGHAPIRDGAEMSEEQLDAERPINGPIPAEIRRALFEQVSQAPAIVACLQAIREARGDLDFDLSWSGRGSYHSGGAIFLDRRRDEASWVASLMHELEHLRTRVAGENATTSMERDEYVEGKVNEEIRCQAQTYVALMQVGNFTQNSKGYTEFLRYLEAEHPELLVCEPDPARDAANWAEIDALARVWLEDKYRNDPSWTTSTGGKTYYEHYGDIWDERNQP